MHSLLRLHTSDFIDSFSHFTKIEFSRIVFFSGMMKLLKICSERKLEWNEMFCSYSRSFDRIVVNSSKSQITRKSLLKILQIKHNITFKVLRWNLVLFVWIEENEIAERSSTNLSHSHSLSFSSFIMGTTKNRRNLSFNNRLTDV